ncbi:copper homeostasis protein CutC [Bacillaceae bacterium SIJ1]|uniref:copper homeostasis protein CutC n=1 Tax=Litoribacterium kuwaitense TaxID=1398745 RepID=UPI0013EDEF9A|nr:copper homeostasis protein CutC [Litoribacterium kuwaitense]NGP46274.1 copper homeostasis protein CutC [Litoribacterium kuwaitense]
MATPLLEVIALLPEDAKQAEAAGADRLELVTAMGEGGLTPARGVIEAVTRSVSIPVNVMVRPHSRSFQYSEEEKAIILADIEHARAAGAAGIVFGALDSEGNVDVPFAEDVIQAANGLKVTFHRAIDAARDPVISFQTLCKLGGIDSVLTSGGAKSALLGKENLQAMVASAANSQDAPVVMPGAGIDKNNLSELHQALRTSEYHIGSAARKNSSFTEAIDDETVQKIKAILKG